MREGGDRTHYMFIRHSNTLPTFRDAGAPGFELMLYHRVVLRNKVQLVQSLLHFQVLPRLLRERGARVLRGVQRLGLFQVLAGQ